MTSMCPISLTPHRQSFCFEWWQLSWPSPKLSLISKAVKTPAELVAMKDVPVSRRYPSEQRVQTLMFIQGKCLTLIQGSWLTTFSSQVRKVFAVNIFPISLISSEEQSLFHWSRLMLDSLNGGQDTTGPLLLSNFGNVNTGSVLLLLFSLLHGELLLEAGYRTAL